jgi:hypothetical protein
MKGLIEGEKVNKNLSNGAHIPNNDDIIQSPQKVKHEFRNQDLFFFFSSSKNKKGCEINEDIPVRAKT